MRVKLSSVNKQTVDGESEHKNKKIKMASARKPEALVWTDDELGLLQETRTQACSPPLLLLYTKECFRVDGKLAWLSSRLISC